VRTTVDIAAPLDWIGQPMHGAWTMPTRRRYTPFSTASRP